MKTQWAFEITPSVLARCHWYRAGGLLPIIWHFYSDKKSVLVPFQASAACKP